MFCKKKKKKKKNEKKKELKRLDFLLKSVINLLSRIIGGIQKKFFHLKYSLVTNNKILDLCL